MFESATTFDPSAVHGWVDLLATVDGAGESDSALVDALSVLERLKSAAAAAQARITMALDRSQRADCASESEHRACSRSVAAQVALARHESPHAGNRHLGVARALVEEMPRTMHSLTRGEISEWRAHLMVRETATLSKEHRAAVDEELDGRLAQMGNRQVAAQARAAGYRLDPTSLLRRTRGAESDRRVTLRPAPDTMTLLTGFLPVAQGVAVHAALRRHADSLRSQGDDRSLGQIMADTLVARCTGRADAVGTPVEVQLVMTDHALLGRRRRAGAGARTRADPGLAGTAPRPRGGQGLGAPSLRLTDHRRAGRHVLAAPALPGQAARLPRAARRGVPHTLVRRTCAPRRPPATACARWQHHLGQRAGTLRELQLRQGDTRLVRDG